MNPQQWQKVNRAVEAGVGAALAGVRKCPELSANMPSAKTKPTPPQAPRRRGLTPRQLSAAGMLVRGHSAVAVAQALGVNERTVRRWMEDPRFRAEASQCVRRLCQEMSGSVDSEAAIRPQMSGSAAAGAANRPEMSASVRIRPTSSNLQKRTHVGAGDAASPALTRRSR